MQVDVRIASLNCSSNCLSMHAKYFILTVLFFLIFNYICYIPCSVPGLFSWGFPPASSLAGFSVGVSFFSTVELRRPRRPGEISRAGEGSAPNVKELFSIGVSII